MAFTLAALTAEIQNDPTSLGYAAMVTAGSDAGIADALNLVRVGITIKRADISCKELFEAIDLADYTALGGNPTAAALSTERRQLAWISGLTALSRVRLLNDDGTDTPVVTNLKAIFPVSSTRTRIIALATRTGSRAEQLFGAGVVITDTNVANALGR